MAISEESADILVGNQVMKQSYFNSTNFFSWRHDSSYLCGRDRCDVGIDITEIPEQIEISLFETIKNTFENKGILSC